MTQRTALVTGGSAGIGEATARALAADGWRVIVAARRKERVDAVASEVGGIGRVLDVTDEASMAELAQWVAAEFGALDLLVNNAGGAKGLDPVTEADPQDWRWMYETNVLGTVAVTNALLPALRKAKAPVIVNIGSIAGLQAYSGGGGYNAAKFGLNAATRALRIEEAEGPAQLRITEIDPGRVETDFSLNRFAGDKERADAVYAGHLNLQAEDIAEAVRWVASLPAHVNVDRLHLMPRDQV